MESPENDELVLKLTYAEFEWTYIEEIIADVQLVKADGSIKTLARNAVFEKKDRTMQECSLRISDMTWKEP